MKNLKKVFSIILTLLVFSANIGVFSLTVLAFEKESLYYNQAEGDSFSKIREKSGFTSDFLIGENIDGRLELESNRGEVKNLKGLGLTEEGKNYIEGEVLVKYKNNKINLNTLSGRTAASNFTSSKSLEVKENLRIANISVLKIKDGKTVEEKIAELKNDPNVEYVQPNFQYHLLNIDTNDTYRNLLWGLHNTGQTVGGDYYINNPGTSDADIDAPEAWGIIDNEGTYDSVVVAVIDTGVAYNHPDLVANMWDGTACVGEDSIGAPLSGGCNHGYDYEDGDKTPLPTADSHGTHIAGTIAAAKDNGIGIIGVAPNVKIMALKSSLTTTDNVKSINFAKENGAKVINASWACYGSDQGGTHAVCGGSSDYRDLAMISAIESFPGLFITAAGNGTGDSDAEGDNHDNGEVQAYPCDHTAPNLICVAATDQSDVLATFSDYGVTSVDVGAPGVNIYSTINESNVFSEDFEEVVPPSIGNNFTQWGSNTWGTLRSTDNTNTAIFGDYVYWGDYQNNISSYLDSNPVNLSGKNNSYLNFDIYCNTEENYDGMFLVFYNGTEWQAVDVFTGSGYGSLKYNLSNYINSNFKFRFFWYTDDSNVGGPYYGCYVDNIAITFYSDGSDEQYGFSEGTSMAAPHVAGLAGLIWGYKPELTYSEVKDIILNTGNDKPSLSGKTVTGKRINAYNALDSLTPPIISDVQTTTTTPTSTNVVWFTDKPSTSKVVYSTTTPVSSITIYDDTLVTNHSIELVDLSASTTYYFYVESADKHGITIATTTEYSFTTLSLPDITAPTLTEVTSVQTPTNNNTPDYTFNSDEAGTISYDGGCTSTTTEAIAGDNTISFNELIDGTYDSCTIAVTDASDNTSDLLLISPFTIDTVIPIISLIGSSTLNLYVGDSYTEPGYTATDDVDGDITGSVVIGGDTVNTSAVGTYIITYNVSDAAGNLAEEVTRTVNVEEVPDTTAPVIDSFIIPETSNSLTVSISSFVAHDNVGVTGYMLTETSDTPLASDPNWLSVAPADYTFSTEGVKTLYAWAKDAAGNISLSLNDSVTITLPDITAPVITLLGDNPVNLYVGDSYTDAGATALDDVDGDLTDDIVVTGLPIDTSAPGTFIVRYNVSDAAGNPAEEVTRTVNVNAAPVTVTGIAVKTAPTKVVYTEGESLELAGLEVTLTKSDLSEEDVLFADFGAAGITTVKADGDALVTTDTVVTITHAASGENTTQAIIVNAAPLSSVKAITAFSFTNPVATGVIDEIAHIITVTVPFDTIVTALVPTIVITGESVSPASGAAQDFTNPVIYTVTAADSSTQEYTVTVNVSDPSDIATVTSTTYTVSADGTDSETITDIPFGTSKADFLAALAKGEENQIWDDNGISDPIITDNTLVVTAQDGVTIVTYTMTVNAAPVVLNSIAITTPATKLVYTVGNPLDITGLVITGTYSDGSSKIETITTANVTGFNSSVPVTDQVLTITFNGKTTTYTINVIAAPASGGGGGGGGGGGSAPPQATTTKGDITGDGKVDKYDFALLMLNWGKTGENPADLNGDGIVDKYDFALLMLNWSS